MRSVVEGAVRGSMNDSQATNGTNHRRGRWPAWWPWTVAVGLLGAVVLVAVSRSARQAGQDSRASNTPPPASGSVWAADGAGNQAATRPHREHFNVLLISIDTTRADHLACYGHPRIKTPNIDRLAAEGVLFSQCIASVPITLPSHSTMMTGTHPYVHGARDNGQFYLHADNQTLAERLKAAGYATAAELAAFVLNRQYGLNQGFDVYNDLYTTRQRQDDPSAAGPSERIAEDVSGGAISLLRRYATERFFLFVHFFDPHQPYQPPARFAQAYAHPYLGEIAYVDEQIGRLLAALKSLGLDERTLLILTSDHGEGLGQHGEDTHMMFVYDTTLLVPLIMRCPGQLPAGRRVAGQVQLIDIAPTVLDFLGLEPMTDAQGESLLPLITGSAGNPTRLAYAESLAPLINFGYSPLRAVRGGGWKYIHAPQPELYHLGADPGELRNQAPAEPERAARMRAQLYELIERAPTVVPAKAARRQASPEEIRRLQALGYVHGDGAAGTVAEMSERELLEVSADDPKDHAEEIRRLAQAGGLKETGDLEGAEKILRELVARSSQGARGSPLPHFKLGEVLANRGKNEEAVEHLRASLRIQPENADALTLLGVVLRRLGRIDEALEAFRQASQIKPVSPRTHRRYAEALHDAGNATEAMYHYRLAIEKDPSFRAAVRAEQGAQRLHGSAIALLQQREYAAAVDTLRAAFIVAPENLAVTSDLAWILGTCPDDAVRDGAEAVRLSEMVRDSAKQETPMLLDTLAAAYAEQGRFDDAVTAADRAIELARQSGADNLAKEIEKRRDLYVARRPYRGR